MYTEMYPRDPLFIFLNAPLGWGAFVSCRLRMYIWLLWNNYTRPFIGLRSWKPLGISNLRNPQRSPYQVNTLTRVPHGSRMFLSAGYLQTLAIRYSRQGLYKCINGIIMFVAYKYLHKRDVGLL